MAEISLLIWILVILIINEDPTSGDITFEEESRKLKLSLPKVLPDERIDLYNEFRLTETILDILKQNLGFPAQKYISQETYYEKQNIKEQPQKIHTQLLKSNSEQKEYDDIENLKLVGDLNLPEFGHLTYNKEKGFLDFGESDLDKDQIADHANWIPIILQLSKDKHDETEKYWEEIFKESQTEDIQSDREIGQINRIGKSGRKVECKDGDYKMKDCNVCGCWKGEWKCHNERCHRPYLPRRPWDTRGDRYRTLVGAPKQMYQKLRDQATGCMPGNKILAAGTKDCPCTCVLPSVMVCSMCPAVRQIVISQEQKTATKIPKKKLPLMKYSTVTFLL